MAERSGFFPALGHDRRYGSADFADVFGLLVGNGVFAGKGDGLQVIAGTDMTISVSSGAGWINGYWYISGSEELITLANANGILPRIDRVVLRLDMTARAISPAVLTGTPGAAAPALTRDGTVYELCLAEIAVAAGATSITQAKISDKRQDSVLCGWVTGLLEIINVEAIFAQIWAEWQTFKGKMDDEDVAAALQHQIDALNNKTDTIINSKPLSAWITVV